MQVEAYVRYWDDAEIDGDRCENGTKVPFKDGDMWRPLIDLKLGKVVDWPAGVAAKFHFKVCDSGTYHLLDQAKNILASRLNDYVPDGLCHGDRGFGDYIIFNVDGNGSIENYRESIDLDDWRDDE